MKKNEGHETGGFLKKHPMCPLHTICLAQFLIACSMSRMYGGKGLTRDPMTGFFLMVLKKYHDYHYVLHNRRGCEMMRESIRKNCYSVTEKSSTGLSFPREYLLVIVFSFYKIF